MSSPIAWDTSLEKRRKHMEVPMPAIWCMPFLLLSISLVPIHNVSTPSRELPDLLRTIKAGVRARTAATKKHDRAFLIAAVIYSKEFKKNYFLLKMPLRGIYSQKKIHITLSSSGGNPFCRNMRRRQEPTPGNQTGHNLIGNHWTNINQIGR